MESLRLRLLAWLLLPLVVVGLVAAGGAYEFIERRLTSAYDQDLGDIARALVPYLRGHGGSVTLDLTEHADAVLRSDSVDQIFYAVTDAAGRTLVGEPQLKPPAAIPRAAPRFWDTAFGAQRIRAVALHASVSGTPVVVMAAETTHKRDRASHDAMFSAIAPVALLSVAALIAVIFGVRRGLGPLELLREELQSRNHVDLRPVDESRVVEELKPLVHELNLMLARLDAAQHIQARFIANAAHQLRTPIAGLVTQLDLAGAGGAERETHIAYAREGAARLARLAQQILSLAAADPVSNPVDRDEPCDLAQVVKTHADGWVRSAASRAIEIEFALEPAPLVGNPLLVGELAANVVDNALRYGAKAVAIATRSEDGRAVLEITDDGPGIAAAERERVFERFHRTDGSGGGSGLGLAIVGEIAARHRATVSIADAPGASGTRVRVEFPRA
jgi:two-component system, OmpR family, sensor histidine kinase TctE